MVVIVFIATRKELLSTTNRLFFYLVFTMIIFIISFWIKTFTLKSLRVDIRIIVAGLWVCVVLFLLKTAGERVAFGKCWFVIYVTYFLTKEQTISFMPTQNLFVCTTNTTRNVLLCLLYCATLIYVRYFWIQINRKKCQIWRKLCSFVWRGLPDWLDR